MIAFNLTLLIQMALFLIFLWGTNRIVFRPLLRTMDERDDQIQGDRAAADKNRQEAEGLEVQYKDRLTTAHQTASQRLHQARYDAYQEDRKVLADLKARAEQEIASERAAMEALVTQERQKFASLAPALIEAMDRQVNTEGSLL